MTQPGFLLPSTLNNKPQLDLFINNEQKKIWELISPTGIATLSDWTRKYHIGQFPYLEISFNQFSNDQEKDFFKKIIIRMIQLADEHPTHPISALYMAMTGAMAEVIMNDLLSSLSHKSHKTYTTYSKSEALENKENCQEIKTIEDYTKILRILNKIRDDSFHSAGFTDEREPISRKEENNILKHLDYMEKFIDDCWTKALEKAITNKVINQHIANYLRKEVTDQLNLRKGIMDVTPVSDSDL